MKISDNIVRQKEKGTVLYIAELDTLKSQIYGHRVISYILNCKPEELPKNQYIPLDW